MLQRLHVVRVLITLTCLMSASALSQDTWSGHAQCQLSVQLPTYSYQELQTWAITGPPTTSSGNVYPATWSVTGQGQSQSTSSAVQTSASWKTNVAPMSGLLTIFVNSANQLIIKSYHSQMRADGAISGGQQSFVKGAETDTAITGAEFEWQFPQIEVDSTLSDVSGSSSTPFTSRIAPMQPPNTSGIANCSWHFSKGTPASQQTSSSPNRTIGSTMAPLVKSTAIIGEQSSSNSVAANAPPNAQTTTPQSSTINCSHSNSIPAIPTSPASMAASHAYNTACLAPFSGSQLTPVASLAFIKGHYFLIAVVTAEQFSTSNLADQYYSCTLFLIDGQSKTPLSSGGGTGPAQATITSLTVNGAATGAEVDCAAYSGISASARTSIVAIEVGALN